MVAERTKLDSIDRRANPKDWCAELARIRSDRQIRIALLRLSVCQPELNFDFDNMLKFIRPHEPDAEVRLSCLELAAQVANVSSRSLLLYATAFLDRVTEADNG